MKIFKSEQVRRIDDYTIQNEPVSSIDLMERAAMAFVESFVGKFDPSKRVSIFAGPGNNGGDGLAIARILAGRFYTVSIYILRFTKKQSPDFIHNLERLKKTSAVRHLIREAEELPSGLDADVIIDAIFGSGLSREVKGLPLAAIKTINKSSLPVVSVDIPSGLFGEDNRRNNPSAIIRANYTISFEFPFFSFFFPENQLYTGQWESVSISLHPEAIANEPGSWHTSDTSLAVSLLKNRNSFSHKGTMGHALLIAGSDGMMGAALLAVSACLRSGAGLVTAHVPGNTYPIVQTAVPEALISRDQSPVVFSGVENLSKYTAVAAGPGLTCQKTSAAALTELLKKCELPMVLDADALNIMAEDKDLLMLLKPGTILTPHPGEFDRLFGSSKTAYERYEKQIEMAAKLNCILVLKGRYTFITFPDGYTCINTTGNPGLATGGSGDVLTGIIVSFLAQGYTSRDAAVLGVYIHGLAADISLSEQSYESLLPGDVIENLGKAFKFLRS